MWSRRTLVQIDPTGSASSYLKEHDSGNEAFPASRRVTVIVRVSPTERGLSFFSRASRVTKMVSFKTLRPTSVGGIHALETVHWSFAPPVVRAASTDVPFVLLRTTSSLKRK